MYIFLTQKKVEKRPGSKPRRKQKNSCCYNDCLLARTVGFFCDEHSNVVAVSSQSTSLVRKNGPQKSDSTCNEIVDNDSYVHKLKKGKHLIYNLLPKKDVLLTSAKDLDHFVHGKDIVEIRFYNLFIFSILYFAMKDDESCKVIPLLSFMDEVSYWHKDFIWGNSCQPTFLDPIFSFTSGQFGLIFPSKSEGHLVYLIIDISSNRCNETGNDERKISFVVKDSYWRASNADVPSFGSTDVSQNVHANKVRVDYDHDDKLKEYEIVMKKGLFPYLRDGWKSSTCVVSYGGTKLEGSLVLQCLAGDVSCGITASLNLLVDVLSIYDGATIGLNLVKELSTFQNYHSVMASIFVSIYGDYLVDTNPKLKPAFENQCSSSLYYNHSNEGKEIDSYKTKVSKKVETMKNNVTFPFYATAQHAKSIGKEKQKRSNSEKKGQNNMSFILASCLI